MRRGRVGWAVALAATAAAAAPALDPWPALPRMPEEAARVAAVVAPPAGFAAPEPFEARPGGAATVPRDAPTPLAAAMPGLDEAARLDAALGLALFDRPWASSPASTQASDGLGPLFAARACAGCHVGDARGGWDEAGRPRAPLVVRAGLPLPAGVAGETRAWPGRSAPEPRARPHPALGRQLQPRAVAGVGADPEPAIAWDESEAVLADGTRVSLRRPAAALPGSEPPPALSLRTPPPLVGLGLLEAIPAAEVLALEDPDDRDGDGISGRAAMVWSEALGAPALGRFGWKAAEATLADQAAAAFALDLGLSTPLRPNPWGDCTALQPACRAAPHGDDGAPEVGREALDLVALHVASRAVPGRPDASDPLLLRGKALFHDAGCPACHAPKHVTARLPGRPWLSFQLVWPFTDLLLHDMGPGLADGLPEGDATAAEWRTAPLWGLASGAPGGYLHDGRARTLLEAVLWHGGEAQASRDAVAALSAEERAALLAYLGSL